MSREIKKELLKIKGGDFLEWYSSLTKLEKAEYKLMLEKLDNELGKK